MKQLLILILFPFMAFAQLEKPEIFFSQVELTASGGQVYDEFYWLNTSGANLTKTGVSFAGGTYRFDLSAYAVAGASQVGMYIDGVLKGTVTISSIAIAIYSLPTLSISAGTHTVKIQINNFSGSIHCRVGLLYFTQTALTTPYVYPALVSKALPAGLLTKEDFGGHRLRGFNLGSNGTNGSGEPTTSMTAMKATGANIARCFVEIERLSGDTYTFKSGELTKLATTVSRGATLGYYVVPVMFHDPSLNSDYWGTSASHIARRASIVTLWQTLATTYNGNTTVAAYDLINEPRSNFNYAEVIRWQTDMIDAIRAIDANHVIAVECISNDMFAMMLPLGYTNIIYSPHGYSTGKITFQGIPGEGATVRNPYPLTVTSANLTAPWGITQLSVQHDDVRIMTNRFHVPVFIGEFSCVNWAPASTRAGKWTSTEWINDNITLLEAEGWSWAYNDWVRGGEYIGWDPEIPSQWYATNSTFTNAEPSPKPAAGSGGNMSVNGSTTAPTIVMLKGWFGLNTVASPYKNLYFSSTGNDANNGTSPASPKKTITELNRIFATLNPGDSVLFKRGDTFYGSIICNKSGAASLPIVIGSYGTGAKPIITGFTTPTFTSLGGNIWESTALADGLTVGVDIVTVNDVITPMGRYPNANAANGGYLTYTAFTSNTSITSGTALTTNWTGAELVLRSKRWILTRAPITGVSSPVISYSTTNGPPDGVNRGFFIQNDSRTLDIQNEWYYNPSTKKIRIYSTTNPGSSVKIVTQANLFTSDQKNYIKIVGVDFNGANLSAVSFSLGTKNVVKDCYIRNVGDKGIYTTGTYFLAEKDSFDYVMTHSIMFNYAANYDTARYCYIKHNALIRGLGTDKTTVGSGIWARAKGAYITENWIQKSGSYGIRLNNYDSLTVTKNFIDSSCQIVDDAAGIYIVTGPGQPQNKGRIISQNFVFHTGAGGGNLLGLPPTASAAHGIYTDISSSGILLDGNVVAWNDRGFMANYGNISNTWSNNTSFDNREDQFYQGVRASTPSSLLSIQNNTFFSKTASQNNNHISADARTVTGIMNNNKYATPSTVTPYWLQISTYGHYNFAGWKLNSLYDAGSTQKTYLPTDSVRLYYNASSASVAQDLSGATWSDAAGTTYTSLTLLPYTGKVLIRGAGTVNQKPVVTLTSPTDGTVITGLTTVSWTATATDADGTIRNVKLYNGNQLLQVDATSSYGGSVTLGVGNYSLTAHATDNLGDSTISAPVNITINALNMAPTVSITSPSTGATDTTGATINITANASDADGTVSSVKFYDGTTLLNTDLSSPYAFTWTATVGQHQFTAVAFDNSGDSSVSALVIVNISDPLQPLEIVIDSYNVLCNGGTGQITVYGQGGLPFSYGYIGVKDTTAHAGTYTFIIEDSLGVKDTGSVTITEPAVLNASATVGTISTYLGSTTATINVTGGTAPYNYQLNNGPIVTGNVFTVYAGSYLVTVTDANGCTRTVLFDVTQPLPGSDKIINHRKHKYINAP